MKNNPIQSIQYLTVQKGFKEWLTALNFEEGTITHGPVMLQEFLHYLENNTCIHTKDITPDLVNQYFIYLSQRKNKRKEGGLSTNTLINNKQIITKFARYLRETDQNTFEIPEQFFDLSLTIPTVLTRSEIKTLYEVTEGGVLGLRDKAMLSILYGCGLRRSEAHNLDVKDIVFERDLLYVRKGKNYTERYVPLTPRIAMHLQNYLLYSRPELKKEQSSQALFIGSGGDRFTGESMGRRLKQLLKKANNNKEVSPHTLRHSIATHLLESGMKFEHIARFLGHTSLESTQIYTHIINEQEI